MTEPAKPITLIVPTPARPLQETIPGAGAVPRFWPGHSAEVVSHAVDLDADLIRANIDKCLAQVKQVFSDLKQPSIDGWTVGTITVGLTITAQGSVGIATAGVEASIEIAFTPTR